MTARPSFGLAVPPSMCGFDRDARAVPGSRADLRREWAEILEHPSIDRVWTLDQMIGRFPTPEPLTTLAYLAAITERVRLGIAILVGPARGPVAAAKSLATLDWLSGGRLDVGLGLGHPGHYGAYGVDVRAHGGLGAILDEFTAGLSALWSGEQREALGTPWALDDVRLSPPPLQSGGPPLWFGGGGAPSLQRAVRLGAGWIGAGRHTTTEFGDLAGRLALLLDDVGRDRTTMRVAKRVYLHVATERRVGAAVVSEWFDRFYGRPELGAAVTVLGDPPECAAQLAEVVAAGADDLIIHPLEDSPEMYRLVLDEVLPLL